MVILWTLGAIAALATSIPPSADAATQELPDPQPASSPRPDSALHVSVAPSIADADLLTKWLEERNSELSDALVLAGHAQWIDVRIDGVTYDYDVSVTAMRDGKPLVPSTAPITCECSSGSLLAMLDREISATVYRLRSTPIGAQAAESTMGATPERTSTSRQAETGPTRARVWSISPLGVAGASTGAFGLIALGAGSVFVVTEPRQIDGWSKLDRDFAPLGYATLSVGAAALVGGVAMIVVDAIRTRKRAGLAGVSTRSRSFALAPAYGGGAGAVFVKRF